MVVRATFDMGPRLDVPVAESACSSWFHVCRINIHTLPRHSLWKVFISQPEKGDGVGKPLCNTIICTLMRDTRICLTLSSSQGRAFALALDIPPAEGDTR